MNRTQIYRQAPRRVLYNRPQTGAGIFDDIGRVWTRDINPFLKKTKVLSTGLGAVAPYLGGFGGKAAGFGSKGLAQMGYGPKPRRKGRKPGPKPKKKAVPRKKRR
jgi:hypothetical protein